MCGVSVVAAIPSGILRGNRPPEAPGGGSSIQPRASKPCSTPKAERTFHAPLGARHCHRSHNARANAIRWASPRSAMRRCTTPTSWTEITRPRMVHASPLSDPDPAPFNSAHAVPPRAESASPKGRCSARPLSTTSRSVRNWRVGSSTTSRRRFARFARIPMDPAEFPLGYGAPCASTSLTPSCSSISLTGFGSWR